MRTRIPVVASAACCLLLSAASPAARAAEISRGEVKDPDIASAIEVRTLRIGEVRAGQERDGVLYVVGTEGIAAISGEGKPLWAARLPHADVRSLDVDGSSIAIVSQDLESPDPPNAFKVFYQGRELAHWPLFRNSTLALLDKGRRGAILWTTPMPGTMWAGPPGLGPARIAYNDGRTLSLVNRTDGVVAGHANTSMSGFSGALAEAVGSHFFDSATRNKPVYIDDGFYNAFFAYLALVDPESGKERWHTTHHGLLGAFVNITAGPILWGDVLVFGNQYENTSASKPLPNLNNKPRVFVADRKGAEVWNSTLDDPFGAVGSLAIRGDRLFVATNVTLTAFDRKGKKLWEDITGEANGALAVSPLRGTRFVDRGQFGIRINPGYCLASDDRFVYVSSIEFSKHKRDWFAAIWSGVDFFSTFGLKGREVISVLDAASGKYVTTLDAKGTVLDLFVIGPSLVVVDETQILFLKPPA